LTKIRTCTFRLLSQQTAILTLNSINSLACTGQK